VESSQLVSALAVNAGRILQLFGSASNEAAHRVPADGGWSAVDVLRHMRVCDAIIAPRVWQIAIRPGAPLTGFDEAALFDLMARDDLDPIRAIAGFQVRRHELANLLASLSAEEWDYTGQHEQYGPMSIRTMIEHVVRHEAEHLTQIESALR
jgi:uncharacterized damage-inducible protein DinB